jgi:hypothetical protein
VSAPFLRLGAYVEWRQRELYRLSLRTLNKLKMVADGVGLGVAVFKALLAIEVSGFLRGRLQVCPTPLCGISWLGRSWGCRLAGPRATSTWRGLTRGPRRR